MSSLKIDLSSSDINIVESHYACDFLYLFHGHAISFPVAYFDLLTWIHPFFFSFLYTHTCHTHTHTHTHAHTHTHTHYSTAASEGGANVFEVTYFKGTESFCLEISTTLHVYSAFPI